MEPGRPSHADVLPSLTHCGAEDDVVTEALAYFKLNSVVGTTIEKAVGISPEVLNFRDSKFVPGSVVEAYFTDTDKITSLLQAVYRPLLEPPVKKWSIWPRYTRVFCILLEIGIPYLIHSFVRQDKFTDDKLPFQHLMDFPVLDEEARYRFTIRQWRFCAPHFKRELLDVKYDSLMVLPITSRKCLKIGNGVAITGIEIHKEYDHLESEMNDDRHVYILKSLSTNNDKQPPSHIAEVSDPSFIRSHYRHLFEHTVESFGAFDQDDVANIILECVDGDSLEDYFKQTNPPVSYDEHQYFWNSMFNLIGRLERWHARTNASFLSGYHEDLTPANILVCRKDGSSIFDCQFRIVTYGAGNIFRYGEGVDDTCENDHLGVKTYGPPRSYLGPLETSCSINNGQASDVWSMACIVSVAATWAVGGWRLVEAFAQERSNARKRYGNLSDIDCFHNDSEVLPGVEGWHRKLVDYSRKMTDDITVRLWPTVLRPAFRGYPESRFTAASLYDSMLELLGHDKGWISSSKERISQRALLYETWHDLVSGEKRLYLLHAGRDPLSKGREVPWRPDLPGQSARSPGISHPSRLLSTIDLTEGQSSKGRPQLPSGPSIGFHRDTDSNSVHQTISDRISVLE